MHGACVKGLLLHLWLGVVKTGTARLRSSLNAWQWTRRFFDAAFLLETLAVIDTVHLKGQQRLARS